MRTALSILLLVAALARTASAEPSDSAMVQAVLDAVDHQDAAAFARLTSPGLRLRSIWFDSAACARQFSGQLTVQPEGYPALLACLGALGLRVASPDSTAAVGPWVDAALTYDPGVRLEMRLYRGKLDSLEVPWLGEPTAAPIAADALASHEVSPAPEIEPGPDVRDAVSRSPRAPAFVELTTCVDRTGKIESVRTRRRSAEYDGFVQAVEARAVSRKFRPFTVRGKPVPVCARELITYPADRKTRALPWEPYLPEPTPEREAAEDATAGAVLAAIDRQDAAAFAALVPAGARISSLWFADPACAKQFSGSFAPTDAGRPALLKCLAGLGLRRGPRQQVNLRELGPRPTLVYDPGVALELDVRKGVVVSIDTDWEFVGDPSAAPVASEALDAHLIAPATVEPDAEVRDALSTLTSDAAFAQLAVCVDRTGKLESIRTVLRSDGYDSYVHAVEAAAARWKFTPFKVHGKAVRVCGLDLVVYPPDRRDRLFRRAPPPPPPPPPPPVPPQNVPPTALEANRIAGNKYILPDEETKMDIARHATGKLVGAYKLCISSAGAVASVTQLRSIGFPAYDAKLMRVMRQWRYRPFIVNGRPAAVCTAVTFIYSLDVAPPAPTPPPP